MNKYSSYGSYVLNIFLSLSVFLFPLGINSDNAVPPKRAKFISHITTRFQQQLTYPDKKKRMCFCQFGYNLNYYTVPLFPVTQLVSPNKLGRQSYGKANISEKNGTLYTCRGGFIDFSHLRSGIDWTVYLAFKIITGSDTLKLEHGSGTLSVYFKNTDKLSINDIAAIAQKIAFERLTWHEIASWYRHHPNYVFSEQLSAFTPEDLFSDFLGTEIGKNVALRILYDLDNRSYSEIATEEISKAISDLVPLHDLQGTRDAYDKVDRIKQLKLPEEQRNKDVWFDSRIAIRDPRYVFKRYMSVGPSMEPWIVPQSQTLGCPAEINNETLTVPQKTQAGKSLYDFYEFSIIPDRKLFYSMFSGKELHAPINSFTTSDLKAIVEQVRKDMEQKLLPDFDKRNSADPVPVFQHIRRVWFAY